MERKSAERADPILICIHPSADQCSKAAMPTSFLDFAATCSWDLIRFFQGSFRARSSETKPGSISSRPRNTPGHVEQSTKEHLGLSSSPASPASLER